ncbi:hypothetical protein AAHC03_013109 [Spirometra sp. Aus1]
MYTFFAGYFKGTPTEKKLEQVQAGEQDNALCITARISSTSAFFSVSTNVNFGSVYSALKYVTQIPYLVPPLPTALPYKLLALPFRPKNSQD